MHPDTGGRYKPSASFSAFENRILGFQDTVAYMVEILVSTRYYVLQRREGITGESVAKPLLVSVQGNVLMKLIGLNTS